MEIDNTATEEVDEDSYKIVKLIQPDTSHEDYQNWRDLCDNKIRPGIDSFDCQNRVRERLHKVFTEIERDIEAEKNPPSQNELAERLGVAVGTINADINKLREILQLIMDAD